MSRPTSLPRVNWARAVLWGVAAAMLFVAMSWLGAFFFEGPAMTGMAILLGAPCVALVIGCLGGFMLPWVQPSARYWVQAMGIAIGLAVVVSYLANHLQFHMGFFSLFFVIMGCPAAALLVRNRVQGSRPRS